MSIHRALSLTTFLLLTQSGMAQVLHDSSIVAMAKSNLSKRYYEERKSELLLIRGNDYAEYQAILDEHPYFLNDDWIFGSICYHDHVYENVPLQYDIHSDKLVTEHPSTGKKIELIPQHVSWFVLDKHHFIFLGDSKVPPGYYELIVDGQIRMLANYHKAFQESTATGALQVRVEEIKRYFLFKNGTLMQIRGKASLLRALDNQRSALPQEIKRKKFGRNREQELAESVRIYNSLQQK